MKRMNLICTCFIVLFVLSLAANSYALFGKTPADLEDVPEEDRDKEILRLGITAELDAVNIYEQMAHYAKDKRVKEIMLHTAKEEKIHVGEFQALLLMIDKEQARELEAGKKELMEELED